MNGASPRKNGPSDAGPHALTPWALWRARLTMPQRVERLAIIRILAPLAILGFLATRLVHADHWLGDAGFKVPELAPKPYSQPVYLAPLSATLAWAVAGLTVLTGALTALGWRTVLSAGAFSACLVYVAWADRLAAFSVNKLGVVLAVALALTPSGAAWSLDARRAARAGQPRVTHVTWGNVRFFQVALVGLYLGSGVAKVQGDWLSHDLVLWTHLHDSYQTAVTHLLANTVPPWGWTLFQHLTLVFEAGAPLWFTWRKSRPVALGFGLAMHAGIGLMFGPVVWFALLVMVLLTGAFLPERWLGR